MTKLRRLINDAKSTAKLRGHSLSRFEIKINGHKAYAECKDCGAGACVIPKPFINECEITGEAVAINCKRKGL